jgi:hypothetical protein
VKSKKPTPWPRPLKRGRPATGTDPVAAVRLTPELKVEVDKWALDQKLSRSEALRRLIERGLKTLESESANATATDAQ